MASDLLGIFTVCAKSFGLYSDPVTRGFVPRSHHVIIGNLETELVVNSNFQT